MASSINNSLFNLVCARNINLGKCQYIQREKWVHNILFSNTDEVLALARKNQEKIIQLKGTL